MPGQAQYPAGQLQLKTERLTLGKEIIFSRVRQDSGAWTWEKAPEVAVPPQHLEIPIISSFPSLQKVVFAYAGLSTGIGYYHFPASILAIPRASEHGADFLQHVPGLSDNAQNYLTVRSEERR